MKTIYTWCLIALIVTMISVQSSREFKIERVEQTVGSYFRVWDDEQHYVGVNAWNDRCMCLDAPSPGYATIVESQDRFERWFIVLVDDNGDEFLVIDQG